MFTDYVSNLGKLENAQDSNPTEVKENHTEFTDTVAEHLFTEKKVYFFPQDEIKTFSR